jgi:hypothetical protein
MFVKFIMCLFKKSASDSDQSPIMRECIYVEIVGPNYADGILR